MIEERMLELVRILPTFEAFHLFFFKKKRFSYNIQNIWSKMLRRKNMRLNHNKYHEKSISLTKKIPDTYRNGQPNSKKSNKNFSYKNIGVRKLLLKEQHNAQHSFCKSIVSK